MNSLKRLFAPPVFDDDIKTQQAYMLHIILWALVCVPIPWVVYTVAVTPEQIGRTMIQAVFGETVNVILLVMLRRGHVRPASILQVGAFWLFFTATAFTGAGVQGEAYLLGYGLVILIAGLLLGARGALVMMILSLLAGGGMVYAHGQGMLTAGFDSSPLATWIISLVLFPVTAMLQYLGTRTTRQALARARASEERYRLISEISSDYTFSTALDSEGNMYLNWVAGAFEEITGYTYQDYVANGGWLAHLHPDDMAKDAQDSAVIKTNKPVVTEVRTFKKDRQLRWVRVYANPVWDEIENRLAGIVGAVQDITEQKAAEAALTQERDLLQTFLENIPDTVYFKDTESRFMRINKAQADFLKLDHPEDAIGKSDLDFQPPDLAERFVAEEKWIVETGQSILNRVEFNPKEDGTPRWLSASKSPVRDASGRIVGTIGISRDVSEQHLAEEREQQRRAMLEKVVRLGQGVTEVKNLKATLERIWHGVHDDIGFDRLAIFLYDQETNTVNGTLGTDDNGNMVQEWDYQRTLDHEKPTSFMRALEQPNGLFYTDNFAIEFEIPAGHEMHDVRDFASVAAWAGDKPVAIITVDNHPSGRPFTPAQLESLRLFAGYAGLAIQNSKLNEALQVELEQRQKFINELENKNAELERFTYTVSHDLKSPLVTITGFLGYLEQDALKGNTERIKGSINRIAGAAKKMQKLLNDLLELSRVGRLMNQPEDVPFQEIVHEAIDHVRGQLDRINAVIEVQRDFPVVHGDRIRLVEVIQNLVDNAVKYSRPKTRTLIQIGLDGFNEMGYPVFFVRDNGIGIETQYHEKIFGLFNKLDSQSDGTGIGLSLVKRIIEVHNGRIWVESEKGKGATFYFSLPAPQKKE